MLLMRRILLVDDSAIAREPLARLLMYEGYDVLAASNGLEAIETLRGQSIDLLPLDVIMPKMNGIQLLESLRQQEPYMVQMRPEVGSRRVRRRREPFDIRTLLARR